MRIVGGSWRARPLVAPRGTRTRPTGDRVREALFSALVARLGHDLGGGAVLDPFAGSGALGLEALSRGAAHATFVESDRAALAALHANIAALGAANRCAVVVGDAFSLAEGRLRGPFSLILLDPPYTLEAARVGGLLSTLARTGACAKGATVTWEHATETDTAWPTDFSIETRKRYGITTIDIGEFEGRAGE